MSLENIIKTQLNNKYDNQFNFFQVKPINDMVFDQTLRIPTIIFKDIMLLIDKNQYLKRYYYLKNTALRNQINQRIKMLTQFYQENLILRYQYPTMIITQTKDIFLKRLKRMKKMTAMEDSSDVSSSKSSDVNFTIKSSIFLKSNIQSQYSNHSNRDQKFSKDNSQYSVYNIYQEKSTQEEIKEQLLSFKLSDDQNAISYLVCDFDDMDIQDAKDIYQKAMKKTQKKKDKSPSQQKKQKKQKPTSSSIVITPIDFIQTTQKSSYKIKQTDQTTNIIKKYKKKQDNNRYPTFKNYKQQQLEQYNWQISNKNIKPKYQRYIYPQQFQSKNDNTRIKALKEKAIALLNGHRSQQKFKYNQWEKKYY